MTAKKRSIWDDVGDMVERGESPVIKLQPSASIPKPPRPRGRPRTRPLDDPRLFRSGVMRTASGNAMRCRNKGCDLYVHPTKAEIVCSPECGQDLLIESQYYVDILKGKTDARDLPMAYRDAKARKKEYLKAKAIKVARMAEKRAARAARKAAA